MERIGRTIYRDEAGKAAAFPDRNPSVNASYRPQSWSPGVQGPPGVGCLNWHAILPASVTAFHFALGSGSDPLKADTDGDGLDDAAGGSPCGALDP
ncbi:MAG: hypothetical protein J6334_03155 [Kiritimatiellae bacterium]|nr:hypothetical protein [Kiritimatiellia bacterium]